jgi:predicted DCC family thiol-disulfide oxidoreductase YuxK
MNGLQTMREGGGRPTSPSSNGSADRQRMQALRRYLTGLGVPERLLQGNNAEDRDRSMREGPVTGGRLVFDGRCGFCTRSVGWLRRLDRHQRVEIVPLQAPGAPESVGATEAECLTSLRWQGQDGSRLSGAAAANAALASALGAGVPMVLYRFTSNAQERGYAWVAANRYRLPGVRPHCESVPTDCGR